MASNGRSKEATLEELVDFDSKYVSKLILGSRQSLSYTPRCVRCGEVISFQSCSFKAILPDRNKEYDMCSRCRTLYVSYRMSGEVDDARQLSAAAFLQVITKSAEWLLLVSSTGNSPACAEVAALKLNTHEEKFRAVLGTVLPGQPLVDLKYLQSVGIKSVYIACVDGIAKIAVAEKKDKCSQHNCKHKPEYLVGGTRLVCKEHLHDVVTSCGGAVVLLHKSKT